MYIKFILFYLCLLTFIRSEYPINGDITQCELQTPTKEEDCSQFSDETNSCCFASLADETNNEINACYKVKRNYTFALNSIKTIKRNDKDYNVTFTCSQLNASCGTSKPDEMFQCREHSSTNQSCCYIKIDNFTDCILSETKFGNETENHTLFDIANILCESYEIKYKLIHFAYLIVLFFIL